MNTCPLGYFIISFLVVRPIEGRNYNNSSHALIKFAMCINKETILLFPVQLFFHQVLIDRSNRNRPIKIQHKLKYPERTAKILIQTKKLRAPAQIRLVWIHFHLNFVFTKISNIARKRTDAFATTFEMWMRHYSQSRNSRTGRNLKFNGEASVCDSWLIVRIEIALAMYAWTCLDLFEVKIMQSKLCKALIRMNLYGIQ